jgi:predicted DNA-binding transcriptional regulator YafY
MKRLERLVSMALVLASRRRLRACDLAEQFRISGRTVYRDVRALQAAGFPVEGNPGDGYRVPPHAYLRPLALDVPEASALALAAQLLSVSADVRLRGHLTSATAKLESILSPEARQRIRRQMGKVHVSPSGRPLSGPLADLLAAVDDHAVLAIAYEPVARSGARAREIEPLGLVRIRSAWLLVAYCRLRTDVRAFRVDRIRSWRVTGERFAPRPDVSFDDIVEREQRRFSGS